MRSAETNDSVPLEIQAPTQGEPYPSTLKSALARYPLQMDVAVVPSTPKHVAGVKPSAAFDKNDGARIEVTTGFDHNFGHPVIFLTL